MAKRIASFVISVLILTTICVPVYGNGNFGEDVVVNLCIDNSQMKINGETVSVDPGRDTAPVILNGRTLVPIRAIIEAFGGTIVWYEDTQSVELLLGNERIVLSIDDTDAIVNGEICVLDTSPVIINERTMLPLRFVAETFGLGVAWDGKTRNVYIVKNGLDEEEYDYLCNNIPLYSGVPYAYINNNKPMFKEYEKIPASFEYYSELDELQRCNVCFSSISTDIMPTEKRGDISAVKPTGWINVKYDIVKGKYLYNRCHLIGFQLTGENANVKNLITGTRYFNVEGMFPFEKKVDSYIDKTGNHVAYRVTPLFKDSNLLADGVLIEAYSVEDNGEGISFCVYCYNVQPGVTLDYLTGKSSLALAG